MTHTEQDSTLNKQLYLLTLNINGLQNDNKRLDLFLQLQNKAIDIIFLQETHTLLQKQVQNGKKIGKENPSGTRDQTQKHPEKPYCLRKI